MITAADLSDLDEFSTSGFPAGYPADERTFFSPVDNVHGALAKVLSWARLSLVVAMYGFDDDALAAAISTKLSAQHVAVMLTLDSSQAAGVHERQLLATEAYPASSVAIGRSERGAIMHLKMGVIDGAIVFDGSTNWSGGGESKQDNQLTVRYSPIYAAKVTARLLAIHLNMLQQAGSAA
jgi:phosphatidylserine/phosphatidylglycerophosphate/cardiolipin synthase-like enzyme